jgi:predicted ribosome quality control (RQC) complex YloA/Tae2 family protein
LRLVLEIRGGRGHLILVGGARRIIATLHPLRRSGKEVGPGDPYRFPPSRPASSLLKGAAPSPWRDLSARDVAGEGTGRPLHRALAARYGALEAEQDFLERKSSLLVRLRREESRLSDLETKVRGDLEEARAGQSHKKKGELLKGAYGSLRRGMSEIELEDYFDPAGGKVRIALDPRLGPQENIERHFRRYRKCARAVPFLEVRLAAIEVELRRTAEARRAVEASERPEELAELDSPERRRMSHPKAKSTPSSPSKGSPRGAGLAAAKGVSARRSVPSPSAGPRRFVSSDGFEILVGRNARGNDELVTRIGRGNDTFLHVSGRPGAHVVIRNVPGKTVPLSTLVEAAKLGAYYSLAERSRGAVAAGMTAEVDYAPLKHVRKPKGGKAGLVLLATRKTLRVRLDPESIDRLLRPSALPESPSAPN